MACNILEVFDEKSDDLTEGVLLLQKVPYFDLNCFDMAVQGKDSCQKFLSMTGVQNLLTNLWNGSVNLDDSFLSTVKVNY